ncbi:hypothetical protein CYPRO_3259 [Cyclonatronum proteinivorum]|uniref:Uncharacterized protein n=1 Tax=Cyclonatronum proteinivorum TaxID=1457365 RepID=A0A345UPU0_9BACT|nr:hypothetical protein [Cyclonatronum proteinivorum]AXJ02492.1 hypothetical protein CYPRO_3259 [Cyclonatronum proteinivorum]
MIVFNTILLLGFLCNINLTKNSLQETGFHGSYSLEETWNQVDGNGNTLYHGYMAARVKVFSNGNELFIDFMVVRDPPGQIISETSRARITNEGILEFDFVDGWDNKGRGNFKKIGTEYELSLEMVEQATMGGFSGHLYGNYTLTNDCQNLSISQDPFTKIRTIRTPVQTINNQFGLSFTTVNQNEYVTLRYSKNIAPDIRARREANLPQIDGRASLWLLLENEDVIKIDYRGQPVSASDPRSGDGVHIGTYRVEALRTAGPNETLYVHVHANFELSKPDLQKLRRYSIAKIRFENHYRQSDFNITNQNFIRRALRCIE